MRGRKGREGLPGQPLLNIMHARLGAGAEDDPVYRIMAAVEKLVLEQEKSHRMSSATLISIHRVHACAFSKSSNVFPFSRLILCHEEYVS